MEFWMFFLIISLVAVVIEIFLPSMFCINFAFAGIITAVVSIFWDASLAKLVLLFAILSLLSIIFIKPMFVKILKKDTNADFNDQYIGKVVKCIENINTQSGAVTVYDERWEARLNQDGEEIPAGQDVRIVRNDSLVLYVERI